MCLFLLLYFKDCYMENHYDFQKCEEYKGCNNLVDFLIPSLVANVIRLCIMYSLHEVYQLLLLPFYFYLSVNNVPIIICFNRCIIDSRIKYEKFAIRCKGNLVRVYRLFILL